MGMETTVILITIGTDGDSLPINKPQRLAEHLKAALSKFEREEYGGEPHLFEVEKIEYGFHEDFFKPAWHLGMNGWNPEPLTLYNLSEEMEKDRQRMLAEGGSDELVGQTGLD